MTAVERLAEDGLPQVIDVMGDAFRDYPLMRFVAGPGADLAGWVPRLVDLFVTRRFRRGGPLLGIRDGTTGGLVAAAALTRPVEPEPSPDLVAWVEQVWQTLGPDARARYDRYAAAWPSIEPRPHHHLNMIGVRRAHAGHGLARPLLETVHALADADPQSAGVSLTTEVAQNVAFYQHFGYAVVGHQRIAPDLETWAFFRPRGRR